MRHRTRGVLAPTVVVAALLLAANAGVASAQSDSGVPAVLFRFEPEYAAITGAGAAEGRDPEDDLRWAQDRAQPLTEFLADDGAGLLRRMADYAGAAWPYAEIPVYLV